jgi:hypothetical protein
MAELLQFSDSQMAGSIHVSYTVKSTDVRYWILALPIRDIRATDVLEELKSNTGHMWRVSLIFVKINLL